MTDQGTLPRQTDRLRRLSRSVGVLLCTAGLLGSASASASPSAAVVKDEHFINAQTPGILDIEGGECFDDPAHRPEAGGVVVLYRPCDLSADNQAYGFVHADEDAAWDPAALSTFAWDACHRLFDRIWPIAPSGDLRLYPVMPTVETWADGDRDVMCVLYRHGGRLTGSVVPEW